MKMEPKIKTVALRLLQSVEYVYLETSKYGFDAYTH